MTRTPLWLWAVLVSPMPTGWYAVTHSGAGVDDQAFFWVGVGAALPFTLYVLNRLMERSVLKLRKAYPLEKRGR